MHYVIQRTAVKPALRGAWDDPIWASAPILAVDQFHSRGSGHHPVTRAKLLYDAEGLYVIFDVQDRYVQCVNTQPQSSVCQDSCVEFFVQPRPPGAYFNFEINCGGTPLVHYMEDWQRIPGRGFKKFTPLPAALLDSLRIYHSLPQRIQPERPEPVHWRIEYVIPFKLFEHYLGPLGNPAGQVWRANLYKCADKTSHPHWASWSPITGELNFHQPQYFGTLEFAA